MMEKKPTTLEGVVRSPRFHMIIADHGWTVWLRNGGVLEAVGGPTLDDAIAAAAMRISALDAMSEVEMAMPEKHAAFDTVAALELCEAAEPCADCGFEHTHGEGHGSDLPALIATLRAAVAEIERRYAMAKIEKITPEILWSNDHRCAACGGGASSPDCGYRKHPEPPTTLESVIRSPRFYALKHDRDGWLMVVRTGSEVGGVAGLELFDRPTLDGAVRAAALRISALDAAEWRKRPPLSDAEALAIYEEIFGERREDYDDDEQREIADEMRAILAADTDDAAYEVIAWWCDVDLVNRRLVAEMRAKYRGAK